MTTTTQAVTIRFPLPPRALSLNGSHGHWAGHAKAVREYRDTCKLAALPYAHGIVSWSVRLHHQFVYCPTRFRDLRCRKRHVASCRCDYQARDGDNALASTKPLRDALVEVGLLHSDSLSRAQLGGIVLNRCRRGCTCGGYVQVTIEPVTP